MRSHLTRKRFLVLILCFLPSSHLLSFASLLLFFFPIISFSLSLPLSLALLFFPSISRIKYFWKKCYKETNLLFSEIRGIPPSPQRFMCSRENWWSKWAKGLFLTRAESPWEVLKRLDCMVTFANSCLGKRGLELGSYSCPCLSGPVSALQSQGPLLQSKDRKGDWRLSTQLLVSCQSDNSQLYIVFQVIDQYIMWDKGLLCAIKALIQSLFIY